jgi:hypothetical protein
VNEPERERDLERLASVIAVILTRMVLSQPEPDEEADEC